MKLALCTMMLILSYFSISYGQNTQTGLIPDSLVKIKSKECICQQGKFNQKKQEFKYAYDFGYNDLNCNSKYKYDTLGRVVYSSKTHATHYSNGVPYKFFTMESYFSYSENYTEIKRRSSIENELNKVEISKSYNLNENESIDSIFDSENQLISIVFNIYRVDSISKFIISIQDSETVTFYDSSLFKSDNELIKSFTKIIYKDESLKSLNWDLYYEITKTDSLEITKTYDAGKLNNITTKQFNAGGLIIWERYENFAIKSIPTEFHYTYEFDEYHNWTKKYVYSEGKLIAIEERTISYYK